MGESKLVEKSFEHGLKNKSRSKLEKLQDIYKTRNSKLEAERVDPREDAHILPTRKIDKEEKKKVTINSVKEGLNSGPGLAVERSRTKVKNKSSPALDYIRSLRSNDATENSSNKGENKKKYI